MKWALTLAGLAALIGVGYFASTVMQQNVELKKENLQLETRLEVVQFNADLFEQQLEAEREIRNAADTAQSELKQDVPDVDYHTPLPDSVQGVLDRFHDSIGLRN